MAIPSGTHIPRTSYSDILLSWLLCLPPTSRYPQRPASVLSPCGALPCTTRSSQSPPVRSYLVVPLALPLKVSGRRERARTVSMSNADICHLRLWELIPVSVLHWYKRVPCAGTRATWQPGFKTQLPWAHRVWFHQLLHGPFWPHHAHFLGLNSLLAQWLWGKGSLTSTFQQLWATPASPCPWTARAETQCPEGPVLTVLPGAGFAPSASFLPEAHLKLPQHPR